MPYHGSIPASAGEPGGWCRSEAAQSVYPRECGGTTSGGCSARLASGLSPRVRGNRISVAQCTPSRRSIPASAGEPTTSGLTSGGPTVYPRECGGTTASQPRKRQRLGLSPRVRGNRFRFHSGLPNNRSIPASAGEPIRQSVWTPHRRVYPRECGGTWIWPVVMARCRGLSPRVRGNLAWDFQPCPLRGSIPASAGEPTLTSLSLMSESVYPRECGGTNCPAASAMPARVYPRECGGTGNKVDPETVSQGLSPRVRGNPILRQH